MTGPDVLVIGGGVIGSACAYYLAQSGLKTTVCEARGLISGGTASQASAGGVRQQGREASELPLSIHAIGLWADLEEELEADVHYRRGGMTACVHQPEALDQLRLRVAAEQEMGLDIRLVEQPELADLVPGISPHIIAGGYCPSDGQADPIRTTAAFAAAAARLGAQVLTDTPVRRLIKQGDRIVGAVTDQGEIHAGAIILAAGAWASDLAAGVGFNLPFRPVGLQMMVTAKRPPRLSQVLAWTGQGLSLKQSPDGGFVIGGGWPGRVDPAEYRADPIPGAMAKNARSARGIFPMLANIPVVRSWLGAEAFSIDHVPALGPVSGLDGLIVAAGFSGHGFALSPAVGRLLARCVAQGVVDPLLAPLSPDRFNGADHE